MTRDLAALAQVWRDLADEARRHGRSLARFVEERYGRVPDDPAPSAAPSTIPQLTPTPDPLPAPAVFFDRLVARHGLEHLTVAIDIRPGDVSRTHTVARGMVSATYARGADDLATLALALHEFGHALFRAQEGTTADPPRWRDEAAAAWAVRALEDPALLPDAYRRAEAARRRLRREAITARLAAFEAAVLAGAAVPAAFPRDLDPAAYPALFDEPGVMASYAAADRWPQPIVGRKVKPP